MDRAILLAREAIEAGDGPAGCVIVSKGEVVAEGRNRVFTSRDPTAHAELLAIRAAASRLGSPDLSGLTLYTTLEPCPMCCGALLSAKISTLVLGARYAQFRTAELGSYSVESLAAMTGRALEIVPGIRDAECRDLRYEALQRSVRKTQSEGRRDGSARGGNFIRTFLGRWVERWSPNRPKVAGGQRHFHSVPPTDGPLRPTPPHSDPQDPDPVSGPRHQS